MRTYLEIRGFGFNGDACEIVARRHGGAVAVAHYGPSRELHDYTAWIPCEREDQGAVLSAVREDFPGAALGRFAPDGLPYGTRDLYEPQ